MSLLGVGEILGGQVIGFIKDKASSRTTIMAQLVLTAAAFALVFAFNVRNKFDYMAYLMVFTWGL